MHLLATLTISLVLVNGVIQWWPLPSDSTESMTFDTRGQEVIAMEEIQQTRQEKKETGPSSTRTAGHHA